MAEDMHARLGAQEGLILIICVFFEEEQVNRAGGGAQARPFTFAAVLDAHPLEAPGDPRSGADEGGGIRLSLERAKRGVMLKVVNACTGMDPAELDRLFDRFYRVEKSRSKQTGGFGVGLSIARSIAEAHKGSIRAECPDANSIRFTVVLR